MKNIGHKSHRIIFRFFLSAQLLIPLGSVAGFQSRYHYPLRIIAYHLLLVASAYFALLGSAFLLSLSRAARSRSLAKYALPLAWGSSTVGLYFMYMLAWGGRVSTGMNLTFAQAAPYLWHPSLVVGALSVSLAVYWGILLGAPLAILLIYAAAAPVFSAVLLRWRVRLRRTLRTPLPVARQRRLLATASGLLLAASVAICRWPPRVLGGLLGDPILISPQDENTAVPISRLGIDTDTLRRHYTFSNQFQKKNVILIIVDACRADHLGVMGYARDTTPFLDSLQRAGHLRVVRACYSASCCTFGGVLSLLRSQHWFNMTKRAFALQDVLQRAGYRVHFILGGDHTHFQNLKFYYGASLDSFADGGSPGHRFLLNDDRVVFEKFDEIAPFDGTPSFFYFHLMSVHALGLRLPSNVKYQPASAAGGDPVSYVNNYDNGIIQADNNIRDLFAQLERKGFLKNSLVVITADHGESLGERNCYGHAHNLYAEEITPPLLIYDPDPVTYRNLDLAEQIDVAPTILDRLGLPIPSIWDGHSLLRDNSERFSYLRIADLYAVIDHTPGHTLEYIFDARARKEEIYDMGRDPHDQQNIFQTTDAAEVRELRTAISAFSVHPGS